MKNKSAKLVPLGILATIITAGAIGWTQRWYIHDTLRLRNYTPSAQVAQLATDTTMNDQTRRLYYVYHPMLDDKKAFNDNCRSSEKTIVLGCYISGTGIYLYNVTDARLNGILQVTAAHETLHAAFERLEGKEKLRITKMLNQAFENIADERIRSTIDDYRKNGADIDNELHSILGTEVRNLSPELEQYYAKYFTNRLKVVEYSEKYEQAFSERKDKIAETDKVLDGLKSQIENLEADLSSRGAAIAAERSRLDGLLAAKEYQAYNNGVAGFNAMVNGYNAQVGRVRNLIDKYNTLVAERNALAEEEGELIKAIDSRPNTLQTQ